MKCTMCLSEFDESSAATACTGCLTSKGCRFVKCPRCGYESPPEVMWLKKLVGWIKKPTVRVEQSVMSGGVVPLSEMKSGDRGEIVSVNTENRKMLRKIIAMGVLPGSKVRLIQKFPSYVFQVGESQFAVDKDVAGHIHISTYAVATVRHRVGGSSDFR